MSKYTVYIDEAGDLIYTIWRKNTTQILRAAEQFCDFDRHRKTAAFFFIHGNLFSGPDTSHYSSFPDFLR